MRRFSARCAPEDKYAIGVALFVVGLLIALFVAACGPSNTTIAPRSMTVQDTQPGGRITVVESQTFQDAQDESRTILILRDTKTGAEYLALQGFGITDMREQCTSTGKITTCTQVED